MIFQSSIQFTFCMLHFKKPSKIRQKMKKNLVYNQHSTDYLLKTTSKTRNPTFQKNQFVHITTNSTYSSYLPWWCDASFSFCQVQQWIVTYYFAMSFLYVGILYMWPQVLPQYTTLPCIGTISASRWNNRMFYLLTYYITERTNLSPFQPASHS